MNFINRNEIANGVYFTNIKDSRFKTMKISVNIVVPLSVETASENALVGGLLVRSCKKYPDFTVLSKKLSSLYGADLTSSLSKHGESQVIKISVSGLDDRYSLDDVSIAKELSELLCSVIFEPNVKNNISFDICKGFRKNLLCFIGRAVTYIENLKFCGFEKILPCLAE